MLKFYKKIFRIKCVEKLNLQFIVVIMMRVPSKRRVGRPGLEPRTGRQILLRLQDKSTCPHTELTHPLCNGFE